MSVVYMLKGGYEGMGDTSRLEWQYENDKGQINYNAVGRVMWGDEFSHVAFRTGEPIRAVTQRASFCDYIETEPDAVMEIYFHYENYRRPWAMVAKVWASPEARDDWQNREKNALIFYIWGANAQLPAALQTDRK